MIETTVNKYRLIEAIRENAIEGLRTDGAHHKQWRLAQILRIIGMTNEDLYEIADDLGVAP